MVCYEVSDFRFTKFQGPETPSSPDRCASVKVERPQFDLLNWKQEKSLPEINRTWKSYQNVGIT